MKLKNYTLLILIILGVFLVFNFVSAQGIISGGVKDFGSSIFGGEPQNPQELAALIIKSLLGFLGMIFFVLVLYGGFIWMTAMGNPENIKKAKGIITTAVVGLAIILLSYAITVFVLEVLLGAGSGTPYPSAPSGSVEGGG